MPQNGDSRKRIDRFFCEDGSHENIWQFISELLGKTSPILSRSHTKLLLEDTTKIWCVRKTYGCTYFRYGQFGLFE